MKKLYQIFHYNRLAKKLIKKYTYKRVKYEDRDVLERIIIPYILSRYNPEAILDIGREDYQHFYNQFFKNKELWTIDIDPDKRQFGAKNHVTDDISNIRNHFKSNYFDFILMNGVFGWGLNNKKKIEKTFDSIHEILRPNGILVLGWNDVPDLTPIALSQVKSLKKLETFIFKPLKTNSFKSKTGEHTYNFYIKK